MSADTTLGFYQANAKKLCGTYDAADPARLHETLGRWIRKGSEVIELGCGSGRDARKMASLGARVTATDGSSAMIAEALKKSGGPDYRVLPLPASRKDFESAGLLETGSDGPRRFDAVVSVACVMHLDDSEFFLTLRNIRALTKENGVLVLSYCSGHPADPVRYYSDRSAEETASLLEDFGFRLAESEDTPDALGRGIVWHTQVYVLQEGGAKAKKQLQSVIFDDLKTATYKFALLKSLSDISQAPGRAARFLGDGTVAVPLGLLIERWIGYYWPLTEIPQVSGGRPMCFVRELRRLKSLCSGNYAAFRTALEQNRMDARCREAFLTLCAALQHTITHNPMMHCRDEEGNLIFGRPKHRMPRVPETGLAAFRSNYGDVTFSGALWAELRHTGLMLSDSISLQWADRVSLFTKGKAAREEVLSALFQEMLPERATKDARRLYENDPDLVCAWSGKPLAGKRFDVDHVIPWSLSRNNSLWNLVPAAPSVNRSKSDRIPEFDFFLDRKDALTEDWRYLESVSPELFRAQAEHSVLPGGLPSGGWWNPLFDAVARELETMSVRFGLPHWKTELF